ncbi:MAG TPA: type I-E CRISPR-associated endoribonuclease Cas2e [Rubricoccaceae bacterium]|nr:type I-E CRISPR-associated endoribonuclease Cas2e [Rubricoccaceae bacterium]
MTLFILERVPPGLRGELGRWMVEVQAGVFVGRVTALVREHLWARCVAGCEGGTVQVIWRVPGPQGFDVRTHNAKGRYAEQVDGVWLVRLPGKRRESRSKVSV